MPNTPIQEPHRSKHQFLLLACSILCAVIFVASTSLFSGDGLRAVHLGAILPLSGVGAPSAQASLVGLELAKETIAAHFDRYAPLLIRVEDSALDTERGKAAADVLIGRGAELLFSSFSVVTNGVTERAHDRRVPLFYDSCNCGFAQANPFAFQIYFDPRKECRVIAEHFKNTGVVKGAFLGLDVPYAALCFEAMQHVFGGENVVVERETPGVIRDYGALLQRLKGEGAAFVLSIPAVNDFASLFSANVTAGTNLPIVCFEGTCLSDLLISTLPPSAAEHILGFGFRITPSFSQRARAEGIVSREGIISAAIANDVALYAAAAGHVCTQRNSKCLVDALATMTLPDSAIVSDGFGADHILDYTSEYTRMHDGTKVPIAL